MKKTILMSAAIALVLSSCKNEEEESCAEAFNFSSGALIVNEGPFQGAMK